MIKKKNIATSIILTLITCGIYGIIWFIDITDDASKVSEDVNATSGGIAFILTIVTCGIYSFFWAYQMGKRVYAAKLKKGLPASDNSVLYLVLCLFGLGIVNYCLLQNDLNDIAEA